MDTMTAVAFLEPGRLGVVERPKPIPRAGEAVVRITTTTICGTDVHIVKGEYAVRPGLVLGHEPVGVIDALGEGVGAEYHVGQRVVVGAITPCGQCFYCLNGSHSQCGGPLGGWRFGNTIDGAWAEYLLVPDAKANLAPIPDGLSDEDVLLVPDIFSTGLSGAESAGIKVGDAVAVFAQGPIGLCATLGAKLRGAALIVAVDHVPARLAMAKRFGADVVINHLEQDPVAAIKRLTGGRGVDAAIEALGRQETFESALTRHPPWRYALESRRLRRQARGTLRGHLRRPGRSAHRHDPVPRRQGTHAPADGDDRAPPRRPQPPDHASLRPRPHP